MSVNQNKDYKMRIMTGKQPTEEEMNDALSEAAAIQMALDETDEYDEREQAELQEAYEAAIKKVRLNLYRLGENPSDG